MVSAGLVCDRQGSRCRRQQSILVTIKRRPLDRLVGKTEAQEWGADNEQKSPDTPGPAGHPDSLTGLPAISLGIIGNAAHLNGYHLGRDRIFGPDGEREEDYSVKTDRDKEFVSDAASALDIGAFKRLREMSMFIVAQGQANAPDTHDIREVIFSPDGVTVLRWDRQRGS
jgi:hypothetical protein